jgi:hypothetical protein
MKRGLKSAVAALAGTAAIALATPVSAQTVSGDQYYVDSFAGNDCPPSPPPGFESCWATQGGVVDSQPTNDPTASLVVAKFDADGTAEINDVWDTFTQDDVTWSLEDGVLSFLYNMDEGDPLLTYLTIKQANEDYALFYNAGGFTGGTTYTFDLDEYFSAADFSHFTVYDSSGPAVPEPATWAMMLMGFGATGFAMRRRRRGNGLAQVA